MKSRYEPLVKLKKRALDKAEQALMSANNEISLSDMALENAYNQLTFLISPKNGSVGELVQAQMIAQAQHREIEACRLRVQHARISQDRAREVFRF